MTEPESDDEQLTLRDIRGRYGHNWGWPMQWLGGGDRRILARVPWERMYYTKLGFLVLVPVVLGVTAVVVFLNILNPIGTPGFHEEYVAAGGIWGLLVLVVDMSLIIHHPDFKGETAKTAIGLKLATRVAFAVSAAIVITEIVIGGGFSKEALAAAEKQFDAGRTGRIADVQRQLQTDQTTLTAGAGSRTTELAAQEKVILDNEQHLQTAADEARKRCADEIQNGSGGQRPKGQGEVAIPLCNQATAAETTIENQKKADVIPLSDIHKQLADLDQPRLAAIAADLSKIKALQDETFKPATIGVWRRTELATGIVAWWWHAALAVLFIVLDSMVVLYKVSGGRTAHDRTMDDWSGMAVDEITAERVERREELEQRKIAARARTASTLEAERLREEADREAERLRQEKAERLRQEDAGRDERLRQEQADREAERLRQEDAERLREEADREAERLRQEEAERLRQEEAGREAERLRKAAAAGNSIQDLHTKEKLLVDGYVVLIDGNGPIGLGGFGEVRHGEYAVTPPGAGWLTPDGLAVKRAINTAGIGALRSEINLYEGALADLHFVPRYLGADRGSSPVLLLQYFQRQSIDQWLFPDKFPSIDVPAWALAGWARNLVTAAGEMWDKNMVHGDIKPQNVLVYGSSNMQAFGYSWYPYQDHAPGSLALCDFGSVKMEGEPAPETFTEHFIAPEYPGPSGANGPGGMMAKAHPLADIYSIGATLYYLATGGQLPPPPVTGGLARASDMNPTIPKPLDMLFAQWLNYDPSARVPGRGRLSELAKEQVNEAWRQTEHAGQARVVVLRATSRGRKGRTQ